MEKRKSKIIFSKSHLLMVFLFGFLILFSSSFVSPLGWNETAVDTIYYFEEDSLSYYNFTKNLTGNLSDFNYFSILEDETTWENGNGTEHSDFPWLPWNKSFNIFGNSTTGIL